jgi:hypothetical protein
LVKPLRQALMEHGAVLRQKRQLQSAVQRCASRPGGSAGASGAQVLLLQSR